MEKTENKFNLLLQQNSEIKLDLKSALDKLGYFLFNFLLQLPFYKMILIISESSDKIKINNNAGVIFLQ